VHSRLRRYYPPRRESSEGTDAWADFCFASTIGRTSSGQIVWCEPELKRDTV
jgi:hypothetical protein